MGEGQHEWSRKCVCECVCVCVCVQSAIKAHNMSINHSLALSARPTAGVYSPRVLPFNFSMNLRYLSGIDVVRG